MLPDIRIRAGAADDREEISRLLGMLFRSVAEEEAGTAWRARQEVF